ncbi:helix-turn-helix domain-containing protein [Streptosporangium jomthongense]|uniref:Helix-turn-helix domain-containing protein n=1 Tax=Streptosporangium jomthongense TaxID=1193683 RepID=A0ABV8F4Y9_9ACTN
MYEVFRQKRGLSARVRAWREGLRLRAADMFAGGISPPRVAQLLGVTRKSAYEWHRAWQAGGKAALASEGAAGGGGKLSEEQLIQLEEGAAAHGWNNQR